MKSLSPDQELYDVVFRTLESLAKEKLGFSIYTHSPPKTAPYPFVKLGPVQVVPLATKDVLLARIFLDLNVWGAASDRGKVAGIAIEILRNLSQIQRTDSFAVTLNAAKSGYLVRPDQSSGEDLWTAEVTTEWQLR